MTPTHATSPGAPHQPWKGRRWLPLLGAVVWLAGTILGGTIEQLTSDWLTKDWWVVIAVAGFLIIAAAIALWQKVDPKRRWGQQPPPVRSPVVRFAGPPVLPPDVAGFVGRQDQLDEVVSAAKREQVITVVGFRGVGTSAFALHAAHTIARRFPDGHVRVDVRGRERKPLKPEQVLTEVRRSLGLPEPLSHRPEDLDAAGDELRRVLARKRVLLFLDNVDDPEQVRHVLPGAAGSLALVAGSGSLETLAACCVPLAELSDPEALELLASVAGSAFVTADPAAASDLVALCARQPLAIRLLGEQIRRSGRPIRAVAAAVRNAHEASRHGPPPEGSETLRQLWDGCDVAYQELGAAQQRMFRMLALVPTTEVAVPAAAELAGCRAARAGALLEALATLGFVEPAGPARYRVRKLLAGSAWLHLAASETARQRLRAQTRLARYYAVHAEEHGAAFTPVARRPMPDREEALAKAQEWFTAEHDLLLQLVTNWHAAPERTDSPELPLRLERLLWRIAVQLCAWYVAEQRVTERGEVCEAILATRLASTDRRVNAWARNELGVVHRCQADPERACDQLAELAPRCHHSTRARARTNLGLAYLDRHDPDAAIEQLEQAGDHRPRADRYGRAVADLALGVAYLHTGDTSAALLQLVRAADAFTALGERRALAAALNNLGLVFWARGDRATAHEHWHHAITEHTHLDDRAGLAKVQLNVAAALIATHTDRVPEAKELLHESLRLRAAYPTTVGTGLCHLHLGDAAAAEQDMATARERWQAAHRILSQLTAPEAAEAAARLASLRPGHQPHDRPPTPRPRRQRGGRRRFLMGSLWEFMKRPVPPRHDPGTGWTTHPDDDDRDPDAIGS